MFTFRTSITLSVMAFVAVLAALLIIVQFWTFRMAAEEAASARMDAASAETLGRLRNEISQIALLVHVLSSSSSVADSDERSEVGPAIPRCEFPRAASTDEISNQIWSSKKPSKTMRFQGLVVWLRG